MANHVKIATIGPAPPLSGGEKDPDKLVDLAIQHWRKWFGCVLPDRPDLVVVPEACDRFSDMSPEDLKRYYQVRADRVRDFFGEIAGSNSCYVTYPAARKTADGSWHNSVEMIDRSGDTAGVYNKNYPTEWGMVNYGIKPGKDAPLMECDFGSVACAICFDLNFEDLRASYAKLKPDLIVFCSMFHGGLMQSLWAYSCRAHFVGAVADLPCEIRNPYGEILAAGTNYTRWATARVNLDCCVVHIDYNRDKLSALKRKYGPEVDVHDPGLVGTVMITSENADVTARQMAGEFEIELLDDYLNRAIELRGG